MSTELWIALISLILGVVATIVVSHYYYRRTLAPGKELTPYLQFMSMPLRYMNSSLRGDLEVRYRNVAITDLCEVQFLIANTGHRSIRDSIAPLTFKVPEGCSLLDAQVLHIEPAGRQINITRITDETVLIFDIPLLNAGEFFVVKLLLNGKAKASDLQFTITAEDLPPVLKATRLPFDALASKKDEQSFDWGSLGGGLVMIAFGISLSTVIYNSWVPLTWTGFFADPMPLLQSLGANWAPIISAPIAVTLLIMGSVIALSSFSGGSWPRPKQRFVLPDGMNKRGLEFSERFRAMPDFMDE